MNNRHKTSQYGQDDVIQEIVKSDKPGTFIEIGAYDGYSLSNTYYLEKIKNWKGILVEPIPDRYNECKKNRWNTVLESCINDYTGYCDFTWVKGYSEMLSGITDKFESSYFNRLNNEVKQHSQVIEKIKCPCITINDLMDKYNMKHVDLISISVSSAEYSMLKSFDCLNNSVKVWVINTNNINSKEIHSWFSSNGYEKYWKHTYADVYIYVHPGLKFSWECV